VVCQNTLSFAMDDLKTGRRQHEKVHHNQRFDPEAVKERLGIMDQAWSGFLARVRMMSKYTMSPESASGYFEELLGKTDTKPLSIKAERERNTILAFFESAPGQELSTAKDTLWGAVNAVTYYIDHVKTGAGADRLDSAWFGSGNALKEKAWAKASELIAR
jgi:hypothetical protein